MRVVGYSVRVSFSVLLTALILLAAVDPDDMSMVGGSGKNPTREGDVSFTNVSSESGLSGIRGNFFSWGDYDNDGHQDLLIDGKRLFRNGGPPAYGFVEVTDEAGISAPVNSGVFGDYDNDGWTDIFCGGGRSSNDHPEHPDILWQNNGDGTFDDVTMSAGGLSDTFPTVSAGWGDMNRDGYLDLYMVNYENGTYQGYSDFFWMNDGDGTFTNRTVESGMDEGDHPYQGRGVSWGDFDNDGWQDLYVSNYRIMRNYLYRNEMGSKMTEVAAIKGVEGHGNDHPVTREGPYYGHSLGSAWGDLDNDGNLDLWVTNLAHKDPWRGPICDDSYLFRNMGEENDYIFMDMREGSGIPIKSIPGTLGGGDELMVSCAMADYDNDGDLDLFLPQIYGDLSYAYSYLYRNDGDFHFTDVSSSAGVRIWNTYGSAWCDYNEDGWMDLVTGGGNWDSEAGQTVDHSVHLFRNDGQITEPDRGWLEVALEGRESNSDAFGSRVIVEIDSDGDGTHETSIMRELHSGTGAHGQQDSPVLHFGIPDDHHDLNLRIQWPMGREVVIDDVSPNSLLRLFEPTEEINVNLSIRDIEEDEMGFSVNCLLENPSPYTIRDRSIHASYPGSGDAPVEMIQNDPIEPGGSYGFTFRIETDDKDRFYGEFVGLCLQWSYPETGGRTQCQVEIIPFMDQPPVPSLAGPDSAYAGSPVVISAEGSHDPEGTSLEYWFDMGDGSSVGWTVKSNITHVYDAPGMYSIYLKVRDGSGLESLEDSVHRIEIEKDPDARPTAVIEHVTPLESYFGDDVEFKGSGYPTYGERISAYQWDSDLEGRLSTRESFHIDDLIIGRHLISFSVRDTSGAWSEPDTIPIDVLQPYVEELWVEIDPPGTSVFPAGEIIIRGRAGPEDLVNKVEIKVDDGDWETARSLPEWEYTLYTDDLSSDAEHVLMARATDGDSYSAYQKLAFTVERMEEPGSDEVAVEDDPRFGIDPILIGITGAGSVLLLAVIIVIFLLFRRKGTDLPPEELPVKLLED